MHNSYSQHCFVAFLCYLPLVRNASSYKLGTLGLLILKYSQNGFKFFLGIEMLRHFLPDCSLALSSPRRLRLVPVASCLSSSSSASPYSVGFTRHFAAFHKSSQIASNWSLLNLYFVKFTVISTPALTFQPGRLLSLPAVV